MGEALLAFLSRILILSLMCLRVRAPIVAEYDGCLRMEVESSDASSSAGNEYVLCQLYLCGTPVPDFRRFN